MLARHLEGGVVVKLRKTMAVLEEELGADRSPRIAKAMQLLDLLIARADTQLGAAGEELRRIGASVEHVKTIVAAQQQHAKTADVAEFVPLAELVNEVVMQEEPDLRAAGIELLVDVDAGACTVFRHKFVLILTHLLGNARDAVVGAERRVVAVRGHVRDDDVIVAVHDSGAGVPPARAPTSSASAYMRAPTRRSRSAAV
jgi:C4-dicarboxylate-specific signal transduction histidine kinase